MEEKKKMEREKAIDKFWKDKQVILRMNDDGSQYMFYIIENTKDRKNKFTLVISHEGMIKNMHCLIDDYTHGNSRTLDKIIDLFIEKVDEFYDDDYGNYEYEINSDEEYDSDQEQFDHSSASGYNPFKHDCDMFHVDVAKEGVITSLRRYFVIGTIKNVKLDEPFANSSGKLFEMYRKI